MRAEKAQREDWSIKEFAIASGFSWKHCYELCGRQIIPAVRVNGRWRLSRVAAERCIALRKELTPPEVKAAAK